MCVLLQKDFMFYLSATGSVLIIPRVHKFWSLTCCFGWSSEKRRVVLPFLFKYRWRCMGQPAFLSNKKNSTGDRPLCFWVAWPVLQETGYPGRLQYDTLVYNNNCYFFLCNTQVPSLWIIFHYPNWSLTPLHVGTIGNPSLFQFSHSCTLILYSCNSVLNFFLHKTLTLQSTCSVQLQKLWSIFFASWHAHGAILSQCS